MTMPTGTKNVVFAGTTTANNFILSSNDRKKDFIGKSIVDVDSVTIRKFIYKNDDTKRTLVMV